MDAAPAPALCQTVIDTLDARRSAEFWRQLLGLVYRPGHEPPADGDDDPAGRDWLNLFTPEGGRCLAFQQVDELPRVTWPDAGVAQQLHLDLTVPDIETLRGVHERVLSLGGELRLDRSGDGVEPLHVYADPDGHTFCVFVAPTPSVSET
jgi:catechol 2,3-dioxygenase-like lactoylglutathione lyase family enzyme